MSKSAIKRLAKEYPSYDLNVAATTLNQIPAGETKPIQVPAFLVSITIFEHGEKGAVITKKASAYGIDQEGAIEQAVERLGV